MEGKYCALRRGRREERKERRQENKGQGTATLPGNEVSLDLFYG